MHPQVAIWYERIQQTSTENLIHDDEAGTVRADVCAATKEFSCHFVAVCDYDGLVHSVTVHPSHLV